MESYTLDGKTHLIPDELCKECSELQNHPLWDITHDEQYHRYLCDLIEDGKFHFPDEDHMYLHLMMPAVTTSKRQPKVFHIATKVIKPSEHGPSPRPPKTERIKKPVNPLNKRKGFTPPPKNEMKDETTFLKHQNEKNEET
jgi:hypothetical protein